MNVLSTEKKARLRQALTDGLSSRAAAHIVGCSRGTVRHWQREWNFVVGRVGRRRLVDIQAPIAGPRRTSPWHTRRCAVCLKWFGYWAHPSLNKRNCCSRVCARKRGVAAVLARRVFNDATPETRDRLFDLYVTRGHTTSEIADMYGTVHSVVACWLKRFGIALRQPGARLALSCKHLGCTNTPRRFWYKRNNATLGLLAGSWCSEHWKERHRRFYYDNINRLKDTGQAAMLARVKELLSGLPDSVRADAEQEIVLAALSGELQPPLSAQDVKPYISKSFRDNADAWKFLSLAAKTSDDSEAQTWGERLGLD